jgi:L-iditol 2-dehydrogenase
MRVAMYYNNKDVRLEEIPTPHIGSGELLVKVLASGICGSDVMEWYRMKKLVLGHEMTGGWRLEGWTATKWRSVFVSHHVPCSNTCNTV